MNSAIDNSYITLRRIVGILGIALPIIVSVWGFFLLHSIKLESSISQYYTLETRDAFVGILFTIGFFLFAYRGYDNRDNIAGNLACICAIGVAVFPVNVQYTAHTIFAMLLFFILSYFCLFLFTKTNGTPTPQKITRNRIYKTCGIIMLACIFSIMSIELFFLNSSFINHSPVFWLETVALIAFGFSWFTKGNTIFRDTV